MERGLQAVAQINASLSGQTSSRGFLNIAIMTQSNALRTIQSLTSWRHAPLGTLGFGLLSRNLFKNIR